MSFSIVSILTVLLTLGQIFQNNGEFIREFQPEQKQEVLALLRSSCGMFLEDENIKSMNVPVLVQVMKNGLERYERKRKEAVEAYCEQVREEALSAAQRDGELGSEAVVEVPQCDENEALQAFEAAHAQEFESMSKQVELFQGFDIKDAIQLYESMCAPPYAAELPDVVRIEDVIQMYNKLASEALDVDLSGFRDYKLPQSSYIYAADGKTVVGELFGQQSRRTWVALEQIPPLLRQAFISAEDKGFRSHKGIDRGGILRGFVKYMQNRKIEGGSTITQQVVKNALVGSEVSLDRKVKEMILAVRLEKELNDKDKILEIYFNLIYLGRNSWGVGMASRNYFGPEQDVSALDLGQAAFLAGITHSPNRYEPDREVRNIRERQSYVLRRLLEDGHISTEDSEAALSADLKFIEREPIKTSYFQQAVRIDVRDRVRADAQVGRGHIYHATQVPELQRVAESSLQEQLARYEMSNNLVTWQGPLRSLLTEMPVGEVKELALSEAEWSARLKAVRAQYQDIHWNVAAVLKIDSKAIHIGVVTDDGPQVSTLSIADVGGRWAAAVRPQIKVGDVVFVVPFKKNFALRVPPQVQGSAVVMEAQTGKVLAVSGGFSVHFTEYNRGVNALRQPGSTLKPFTYLAALQAGFQPDTNVPNDPIYFPKVEKRCNAWRPRNYSDGAAQMTLRRGLETSSNRVTARLLQGMNPNDAVSSLNLVREVTKDFGVYETPYDCFPFILGSDETSLLRLVGGYAAIANGGTYVEPHFIDESKNSAILEKLPRSYKISSVDAISIFQLKNIMAGVVTRGTAQSLKPLNGSNGELYIAGKTGTSSGYNDAWFVGFSDKVVVGVWLGYDQRRALSGTGGSLAAPVAKAIFEKAFEYYPPADLLARPPLGVDLIRTDKEVESFRVSAPDTKNWIIYGYGPSTGSLWGQGPLRDEPATPPVTSPPPAPETPKESRYPLPVPYGEVELRPTTPQVPASNNTQTVDDPWSRPPPLPSSSTTSSAGGNSNKNDDDDVPPMPGTFGGKKR